MESKWKHAIGNSVFALRTVYRHAPAAAGVYSLFMLASSAFVVLEILFLEKLVTHATAYIQNPTDGRQVFLWGALYVASQVVARLYGFSERKLKLFLNRKLTRSLSPSIMEKFSRIAYQYYENKEFQDCLSRMTQDPQQSIQDAFTMVNVGVNQLLKLAGILGIFFRASVWIGTGAALIGIPMSVLNLSATYRQQLLLRDASTDQRMGEYIQELFYDKHAAYEIRIFRAREHLLNLWGGVNKKIFARHRRGTKVFLRAQTIVSLLKIAYSSFTVINLLFGFLAGIVEIGVFVSVVNAIRTLFGNLNAACQSIYYLEKHVYAIGYYREFLTFEERRPGTESLDPGCDCDIRFENVCFRYPGTEREILHDLSFQIKAGEKVALVGVNGAGKSTIVKLLCGLYTPDSGRITIGGKDIGALSGEALHKAVSVVFQDFGCYQLTLRENIAFGNLEKLNFDADLKEALSLAEGESISDGGLDIPLGRLEEGGMDLSRGQWQKIAISRAFLSNAGFIILDEPTASLDPIAESRLYDSFSTVLEKQGSILISHRLASARLARRIIVLDGGEVAETGSHEELMKNGGLYSVMFEEQSEWYKNEDGIEVNNHEKRKS